MKYDFATYETLEDLRNDKNREYTTTFNTLEELYNEENILEDYEEIEPHIFYANICDEDFYGAIIEREDFRYYNIEKNKIYDYYAIEEWVDGFGADTYVRAITKTLEQAENFIRKNCENAWEPTIVGGMFGEELEQAY